MYGFIVGFFGGFSFGATVFGFGFLSVISLIAAVMIVGLMYGEAHESEYETDKTTETDGLVYDKYKATLDDGRDIPLVEMLEIFCTLHGSAVRSPKRGRKPNRGQHKQTEGYVMYTTEARARATERLKEAEFVDAALEGVEGLDPLNIVLDWAYHEPSALRQASDSDRRAAALEWLTRHNRGVQAIARHARNSGMTAKVGKVANDYEYGLEVLARGGGFYLYVRATVSPALTCEMVPTGEVEHIAAHDRPVMERRCPDSIFEGIQEQVAS